jgi:hypothetical protein
LNPKDHYRVHNSLPPVPDLSQINLIQTFSLYPPKILYQKAARNQCSSYGFWRRVDSKLKMETVFIRNVGIYRRVSQNPEEEHHHPHRRENLKSHNKK